MDEKELKKRQKEARQKKRKEREVGDAKYQIALGKKISKLRKERGWNQEKFSVECGIERSALARLELGRVNCTINILRQISDAFGIRIGELVDL
jgi:ribosome-binding protein aMBF1 (putative translation factor)